MKSRTVHSPGNFQAHGKKLLGVTFFCSKVTQWKKACWSSAVIVTNLWLLILSGHKELHSQRLLRHSPGVLAGSPDG